MVMPKREPTKVVRIPVALSDIIQELVKHHKMGAKAVVEKVKVVVTKDKNT